MNSETNFECFLVSGTNVTTLYSFWDQ